MVQTSPLKSLMNTLPQVGRLDWIGLRPARGKAVVAMPEATVIAGKGLEGDRFKGRANSTRQMTLIQAEHLEVMRQLLSLPNLGPEVTRRNLVVSGINLLALKGQTFSIGEVVLEGTTVCAPCSKMETALGPGGYNAMRGHGGLCARVIQGGQIRVGDAIKLVSAS